MGSVSSELSLDFKPCFIPKTITGFLREVSGIGDFKKKLSKIEEYVGCLEEERRKIDAFKRELPLCMLLLNDAIEAVKEEEMQCRLLKDNINSKPRPVLEEFIPIKSKLDDEGGVREEKDSREKMHWMSSALLWSDSCRNDSNNQRSNSVDVKEQKAEKLDRNGDKNGFLESKYRNGEGAFMLFKGFSCVPGSVRKEEKEMLPMSDLSLLSPGVRNHAIGLGNGGLNSKSEESRGVVSSAAAAAGNIQSNTQPQLQPPRKARRCWSPELHRRFVNALLQLGGSQVATPKQIRELMKVDGLTNDEVKSHLQKYRLHTRRLPTSNPTTTANQQAVVMGWVPHDHYEGSSKHNSSQSGSPQGPLQLAATTRGISTTSGDSGEDDDGKSDSYSWRGHLQRSGEEETE